ncbi:MAG: GGDEF domain-containing protein [Myxococcota bacterium]|nr:GGDEF domain-containing protein [Myxococcota bacterium]
MSDFVTGVDLSTGAWTRQRFEEELGRAVSAAHRHHGPLSLLYVDVDELQEHNDLHGTDRGDEVISRVAELISREADGRGPIGRVDGGAFGLLLHPMAEREAVQLAERIRRNISARLATPSSRVTVSVGVAQLKPCEPWGNLLDAAQQACTWAKQSGRNAVASR